MEFKRKDLFTVPNILTYVRIAALPVFVWLMLDVSLLAERLYVALAVFVFAELTDLVDGWVARRFNQVSDIGKILDPIADKLLQVAAVVCLTLIGHAHWAFAAVVVLKEAYMLLGGVVILKISGKKVELMANKWGKISSLLFTVGYVAAFFHTPEYNNLYYVDWGVLGLACLVSLMAAVQYTAHAVRDVKKLKAENLKSATNGANVNE